MIQVLRNLMILLILLPLLNDYFVLPQRATAQTFYYVDVNHINANDDLSHGSIDQPWQTLDYAFQQLEPGDTLLVRGGVYQNGSIVLTPQNSGLSYAPITVRAYPDEEVIIQEGDPITLEGTSWWTFDGIIFDLFRRRAFEIGQHASLPRQEITALSENITISNCEFRDGRRTAINVHYANQVLIENNYFHNIRPGQPFNELGAESSGVDILYIADNITITNNRFEEIGSDGVHIGAWSYIDGSELNTINITNNEFWVNRPYDGILGNVSENGIDIKKVNGPVLISKNQIYGFRPTVPEQDASGANGDGIVIHNDAQNIIIEKNYFFDNTSHIFMFQGIGDDRLKDIIIRNNVFEEARTEIYDDEETVGGYALWATDVAGLDVYHNTFYNNDYYLRSIDVISGTFQNNIIQTGSGYLVSSEWSGNYNAWSQIDQPIPEQLMDEQDISQQDLGLDENLRPTRNSLVRDKGQNFEVADDFEDKPRTDNRPDLGAIEFGGIIVKPATRSIQLGQSTQYSIHFAPSLDLPDPIDLNVVNPSPEYLTFEPDSAIMNPGDTITITVTDTHSISDILTSGLWHQIPVVASYSQTVQNVDVARLLVGGTDVYLPVVIK